MQSREFRWQVGSMELAVQVAPDAPPALLGWTVNGQAMVAPGVPSPLVEVGVVGSGRSWSSRRYLDSVVSAASTCTGHHVETRDGYEVLTVTARHGDTGLETSTELTASTAVPYLRIRSTLTNTGSAPVDLSWVTSALLTGVLALPATQLDVQWADNDWLAENRWQRAPLADALIDINRSRHEHDPRGNFSRTARGAWSTDGTLPLGILSDRGSDRAVAWQIDHNGAWHWQVGARGADVYLSVLGPTDAEHQWGETLSPGESFTTVPVVVAVSTTGWAGALEVLTTARRDGRRPHPDHTDLPVVFNDYMNTLMGDPTTAKLLPLIDAAAEVGAEIFCIDAGWYDDDAAGWWDSVGAWTPAAQRFPGGLGIVVDHIRERGMQPGLWLEPEVVGVRSPLADELPAEAFFSRHGRRVVEHGRFHLDLRHPAAVAHLDGVVDRLVSEFGIRFFKLDHNINPGAGTDREAHSVGGGLLGHNRALLAWLDGVLDRHPGLTIENCASGGMRSDYAQLSRLQVQSTSDQQDPLRYPPIAASAHASITPEQAANWAYPQPSDSDDAIAFTMNTAMLGRVYLSGHLDLMTPEQRELVAEGVRAYRELRPMIPLAQPIWPWGLPGWEDGWLCHGLRAGNTVLVTVWRRDDDVETRRIPFEAIVTVARILYPAGTDARLDLRDAGVDVTLPRHNQAVTFAIEF